MLFLKKVKCIFTGIIIFTDFACTTFWPSSLKRLFCSKNFDDYLNRHIFLCLILLTDSAQILSSLIIVRLKNVFIVILIIFKRQCEIHNGWGSMFSRRRHYFVFYLCWTKKKLCVLLCRWWHPPQSISENKGWTFRKTKTFNIFTRYHEFLKRSGQREDERASKTKGEILNYLFFCRRMRWKEEKKEKMISNILLVSFTNCGLSWRCNALDEKFVMKKICEKIQKFLCVSWTKYCKYCKPGNKSSPIIFHVKTFLILWFLFVTWYPAISSVRDVFHDKSFYFQLQKKKLYISTKVYLKVDEIKTKRQHDGAGRLESRDGGTVGFIDSGLWWDESTSSVDSEPCS